MHLPLDFAQSPRRVRWVIVGTWAVIAVKCVLVWWVIERWHIPFHPLWIVAPTLAFAALATGLWLTHHEEA